MSLSEIRIPDTYTYVTAFLTMRCNLSCSYCLNTAVTPLDRWTFKEMSGNDWVTALNTIRSRPSVPITLTGGEPFLHRDFFYILDHVNPDTRIDLLTNLSWGEKGITKFIRQVDPERLRRDAPYPSIRATYHPEQVSVGDEILENCSRLRDAGFSVGLYGVLYPSANHLAAISRMQLKCKELGIEFRVKEYLGHYRGESYGDYSMYPDSVFQETPRARMCKISELLIGTDGNVYRCHRDLYSEDRPVGNLLDPTFRVVDGFRPCEQYGHCHPCDVKSKTDYMQRFGYTSVEIKGVS